MAGQFLTSECFQNLQPLLGKQEMHAILPDRIVVALKEANADDIVIIDLEGRHSLFSYMIVASSKSAKHSVSLARVVSKLVGPVTREGMESQNWISMDVGDGIVHIFLPEVRKYYDVEGVWRYTE